MDLQPPKNIEYHRLVTVPTSFNRKPWMGSAVDEYQTLMVVATDDALTCIEPGSGSVIWSREDVKNLPAAGLDLFHFSTHGAITRDNTIEVFDVMTGVPRWNTRTLGLSRADGFLPIWDRDLLIIYGQAPAADATEQPHSVLLAVNMETGAVTWRRDSPFSVEPDVFRDSGVRYLLGHQSAVMDTDSTFVVYLSEDGPLKIHAGTGDVLWRTEAFGGRDVPARNEGYAPIIHDRNAAVMFVPSERGLQALSTRDGSAKWDSIVRFRSRPIQMQLTANGVLVRGADWKDGIQQNRPFLDLLDAETGRSVWPRQIRGLPITTRFVVRGDTVFFSTDRELFAIELKTGSAQRLAEFEFEDDEAPGELELFDDGFSLISAHNVLSLRRDGGLRFHHHYPAPGESIWEVINTHVTTRPTTQIGQNEVFIYSKKPDRANVEGYSLVQLDVWTGNELGRTWIDERNPAYTVDPASATVLVWREDDELQGFKFIGPRALAHAARNGRVDLVNTLLDRGADVHAPDEAGWTALTNAANNGHADVVRTLMDRGARVNTIVSDAWTLLMIAERNGHAEIFDIFARRIATPFRCGWAFGIPPLKGKSLRL